MSAHTHSVIPGLTRNPSPANDSAPVSDDMLRLQRALLKPLKPQAASNSAVVNTLLNVLFVVSFVAVAVVLWWG